MSRLSNLDRIIFKMSHKKKYYCKIKYKIFNKFFKLQDLKIKN